MWTISRVVATKRIWLFSTPKREYPAVCSKPRTKEGNRDAQLILKIHTTSNFLKVLQTMELKMENCLPADFGERVRNWRSNRGAIIRSVELPPPNLLIQLINVATVGYLRNDQSHRIDNGESYTPIEQACLKWTLVTGKN